LTNFYNWLRWLLVIFTIIMVALFFLPFSSMIGESRERFKSTSERLDQEAIFGENLDISASEYLDMSMFGLLKITISTSSTKSDRKIVFMVFGGICICMLLFALLNKPILTLLFDIAAGLVYSFILYDLNPALFSGYSRKGGISYILYKPLIILIGLIAILCIIAKKVWKRKQTAN